MPSQISGPCSNPLWHTPHPSPMAHRTAIEESHCGTQRQLQLHYVHAGRDGVVQDLLSRSVTMIQCKLRHKTPETHVYSKTECSLKSRCCHAVPDLCLQARVRKVSNGRQLDRTHGTAVYHKRMMHMYNVCTAPNADPSRKQVDGRPRKVLESRA